MIEIPLSNPELVRRPVVSEGVSIANKRRREKSPRKVTVSTSGGAATTLTMGTVYNPPTEMELGLILELAEGKSLVQVSQERGKYDEWASHTLKRTMQKLSANSHIELIIKAIALGLIRVEAHFDPPEQT